MSPRRKPRFEVVTVDGGHFVRFIANNGRIVWVTPGLYAKRSHAFRAIELIAGWPVRSYGDTFEVRVAVTVDDDGLLEVRTVDERSQA